jgi:acyl-CoA dehydrogenase
VPESAGGFGVPIPAALSLLRVAAAHAAPVPLAETMLAGWLLSQAGLEIPDGPLSIAPTRDNEALTATRTEAGWHLAGTATRIPWARDAGHIVALAAVGDQAIVVRAGRDAFTCIATGTNVAHEPRDTIQFDGPAVAAIVPELNPQALRLAGAALRTQQIAGALGRLSAMTVQYAQDRVQFGRPIGKFQAVQQNLAVLAGQAAAAAAAADIAAEAFEDNLRPLPIAAGKARSAEAASIAAGIAHQVHGAIGFTFEHDLHFITRRLWSWRDEFGNETAWNRFVGRLMAQAGGNRLWESITAA